MRKPVFIGLVAAFLLWSWMFLTVRYNYGGHWTALYFIGPNVPQTPPVAAEHPYLWYGTPGYDGQVFHVMAHDPWMRYGPPENFELRPFRYVRILVPALAWLLAFGRDAWIDPSYYFVIVAFTFLGAYWAARWALRNGLSALWGFAFLATPAAITSADRMLCDVALAALCAGFVVYAEEGSRAKIFIVLACAALVRETGAILPLGFAAYSLLRRRWANLALACAALVPLAGWELYVRAHSLTSAAPPPVLGWIPFEGFLHRTSYIFPYTLSPALRTIAIAFDYVALAAVAVAVAMVIRLAARLEWTPQISALYGFALAAIFLRGQGEWAEVYSFGRLLTPLLLLTGLVYLPRIGWLAFAPMFVVGLRVTVWLARQVAGILHALLS